MFQNVDRHRKYDGGVVLGGDAAEGLKISQLEHVCNHTVGLQSPLTCRADGLSDITSAASLRARLAFCSPSAAIT